MGRSLMRMWPILALAVVLGLLALIGVLYMQSTAAPHGAGKESGGGGYLEDAILGVFTIVVFILLLIILRWKAWDPIIAGLHKREETLHGAHAEAQKLREDAAHLRVDWEKKMAEIQDQVRQIHEEARQRAERNAAEIASRARADIQSERVRMRHEIDAAKDQALSEIWRHTAELVTEVSSRAIRRQINGDDQRRLVEDALAELKTVQN